MAIDMSAPRWHILRQQNDQRKTSELDSALNASETRLRFVMQGGEACDRFLGTRAKECESRTFESLQRHAWFLESHDIEESLQPLVLLSPPRIKPRRYRQHDAGVGRFPAPTDEQMALRGTVLSEHFSWVRTFGRRTCKVK